MRWFRLVNNNPKLQCIILRRRLVWLRFFSFLAIDACWLFEWKRRLYSRTAILLPFIPSTLSSFTVLAVREMEAAFSSFRDVLADEALLAAVEPSVAPFLVLTPPSFVSTVSRVRVDVDVDPAPPPRLTSVEFSLWSPDSDRDSVDNIDGVSVAAVDKECSNEADDFPCWTVLTRAEFPAMTVEDGRVVLLIEWKRSGGGPAGWRADAGTAVTRARRREVNRTMVRWVGWWPVVW